MNTKHIFHKYHMLHAKWSHRVLNQLAEVRTNVFKIAICMAVALASLIYMMGDLCFKYAPLLSSVPLQEIVAFLLIEVILLWFFCRIVFYCCCIARALMKDTPVTSRELEKFKIWLNHQPSAIQNLAPPDQFLSPSNIETLKQVVAQDELLAHRQAQAIKKELAKELDMSEKKSPTRRRM